MNAAGNNGFTGTIPSEIRFLTGLVSLSLGKWKYVVDHFNSLRVSCVANHNLTIFESHYN